jgi:ABC-2 type transport system ATP-binding protein
MAMIEISDLSKRYAQGRLETVALAKLDLAVDGGEALALLGPNGAGKSTVVRILSTLVQPESGHASVANLDVVEHAPRIRERIGVTLQTVGLYPGGRVRQVLVHHARIFGLGRRVAARRSDEIIELAGLGGVADRRVDRLSGGMRRRVDLGLAFIHRPPVLLLDEPTDSLDPFSRREFWSEFARMRDQGTCILFATQDIDEAEQLADRAAILLDGTLWRGDIPPTAIREVWWSGDLVAGR